MAPYVAAVGLLCDKQSLFEQNELVLETTLVPDLPIYLVACSHPVLSSHDTIL